MNPAEEIVKFWLQNTGYFFQSSIRVEKGQNREIDILAMDNEGNNRKHIEVSVSIKMRDHKNTPKTRAEKFLEKFNHPKIKSEAEKKFKNGFYEKELVVGDITLEKTDGFKEFSEHCKNLKINVIPFSKIIKEVANILKEHNQLNPIIKTVQLCQRFLT